MVFMMISGIIFLPKNVPHAYRITSAKAEMMIICTPGGNEGLYRYVGRDRAAQRPDGWAITRPGSLPRRRTPYEVYWIATQEEAAVPALPGSRTAAIAC
jgi:hypothetical protein